MPADIVEVKVNASKVDLKLEEFPEDVRRELLYEIELLGGELVDRARGRAEELLQVRTGKFVGRIRFGLKRSKNSLFGRVFSSDVRANLFEWGGTTPPHEIAPNKARALLLQMQGGTAFAARVHHPGGKYKRLQIIHGAFDEMKPQIQAGLEDVVAGAAARASE
jgi:hypothetical protein